MKQKSEIVVKYPAKQFFDLDDYPHSLIFFPQEEVWEALNHLKPFLNAYAHTGISCPVPEGVYLENRETISIGEGTVIEPGAFLRGPLVIGKHCVIRHGAYLRGEVLLGDRCVIGHATEVKHSVFLHEAKAAHFAYVGDSVLGNGVNLGAGAKCANVRLDQGNIVIRGLPFGDVKSGRKKLGSILGDGAQVGCNAVLSPGTILGKRAMCYPCVHVRKMILEGETVKT